MSDKKQRDEKISDTHVSSVKSQPSVAAGKKRRWWLIPIIGCGSLIIITIIIVVYAIIRAIIHPPVPEEPSLVKCIDPYTISSRQTTDQPDDFEGYQIHLVYALPSDGTDREFDTNAKISTSVSAWQNWLCTQTGGKKMKIDTYKAVPDITFVRLDATDQQFAKPNDLPYSIGNSDPASYAAFDLDIHLNKLGFNQPNKLYALYYDGSSSISCGIGTSGLHTAVEFLHGKYPTGELCDEQSFTTDYLKPKYLDLAYFHEIVHNLGFMSQCAPNYTSSGGISFPGMLPADAIGHVNDDSHDLMYTGDQQWITDTTTVLDKNHDDYYDTNNPNCRDLKNSIFLDGGGQELPPKWDLN